jgi:hypothetical protein
MTRASGTAVTLTWLSAVWFLSAITLLDGLAAVYFQGENDYIESCLKLCEVKRVQ